jgi:hypothetical protein
MTKTKYTRRCRCGRKLYYSSKQSLRNSQQFSRGCLKCKKHGTQTHADQTPITGEVWREMNEDNITYYSVSNMGRVRCDFRKKILKGQGSSNRRQYPMVRLCDFQGGFVQRYIHRLVLKYFIGNPPEGKIECNHRDGDTKNNKLENLEYVSHAENRAYAVELYNNGVGRKQGPPEGNNNGHGNLGKTYRPRKK